MKSRPIIMSAESVRAIFAGRKTQTRRVMKPQPPSGWWLDDEERTEPGHAEWLSDRCVYGSPGDRLWVREAFALSVKDPDSTNETEDAEHFDAVYRATAEDTGEWTNYDDSGVRTRIPPPWRSPLYMPRWASRITLEVTQVRVQRLHDIDEADALAEGVRKHERLGEIRGEDNTTAGALYTACASDAYAVRWDAINGKRAPWSSNSWVWAVTFKRVDSSNLAQ